MRAVLQDLVFAARSLARGPVFSAVVIATMAIGIGMNVAMFVYLSYFVRPTVEAPRPDRVAWIFAPTKDSPAGGLSYPDFVDLHGATDAYSSLAAFRPFGVSIVRRARTDYAWGLAVSGDYFTTLGSRPELGRLLEPADDRPGADRVVVLNHFYWQRHFGGDPSVVGSTVRLDGDTPYTVVGVTTKGFQGTGFATGIYVPIATAEQFLRGLTTRTFRSVSAFGRLRDGVTPTRARELLTTRARGLDAAFPEEEPRQFRVVPVPEATELWENEPIARGARLFSLTVGLLLLLATANVANLMLARAHARQRETAIHAALGASRWTLARRVAFESLMLATIGGFVGLAIARGAIRVIGHYLIRGVPVGMGEWGVGSSIIWDGGTVALFFAGITIGTALLSGLAPLVHLARINLASEIKSQSVGSVGRRAGGRNALVGVQIALSVVLLVAAGLMARTILALRAQSLGFRTEGRFIAATYVPARADRDPSTLYRDILDRARALPGVVSASLVRRIPASIALEGNLRLERSERDEKITWNDVSDGYFATLGIPLLAGRDFDARDLDDGSPSVIVNRAAAERLWRGASPIGKTVTFPDDDDPQRRYEIVGVVGDSREGPMIQPIGPHVFFPLGRRSARRMALILHARGNIEQPLRTMLRETGDDLAILDLQPLAEQVRRASMDQQMNFDFASAFGLMGLLLAALGLFSLVSYTTARRTREFGIRMALGGNGPRLVRLVLGESARLLALSIGAGLAASWFVTKMLANLVYGITVHDSLTLAIVPLVILAVGLVAAAVPAARVARLRPMTALRDE